MAPPRKPGSDDPHRLTHVNVVGVRQRQLSLRTADLIAAGIVDPVKVVRTALENSTFVVSVLLLTVARMTEIPEPAREQTPEPEMGM